jgi:hypothetical protein
MDSASERAVAGPVEERQSRLFFDLRKRNERRALLARRAASGIAQEPDSLPGVLEPSAEAAQADLASSSGKGARVH